MNTRAAIACGLFVALSATALFAWLAGPQAAPGQIVAGGGANASQGSRYLTPRTPDADGLSELFERVARSGGIAHLPAGTYRVNRTIRLEGLGPIRIEGEGHGVFLNPDGSGFRAQQTRLLWTGEAGGTMIHLVGSVGQSFAHLHFDGGGKAGRLVHLSSKPGFGTSNQRFTRVQFGNADLAIQCGDAEGDFNCADLIYDDVTFWNCKTGLRVVNHQSVNHHFRSLAIQHVGTAFDFQRGGNLLVDGWHAGTFDLLLRVGYGGPNAGIFRLVSGRPEMNGHTRRYARLLEAEVKDCAQVVFEATQESGGPYDQKLPDNAGDAAFKIGRGTTLIVRDHYHFRPPIEFTTGGTYKDQDSRWQLDLAAVGSTARGAGGGGKLRITGAADPTGKPIGDVIRE